jgi:hypothetical protein
LTSSPPDAAALHSTNKELNETLDRGEMTPQIRGYIRRLSRTAELNVARYSIEHQENQTLKAAMSARKKRTSGKRVILENAVIASVEEIFTPISEAEQKTAARKQ